MILAVAATQMEMTPFLRELGGGSTVCRTLVAGVGCVATTLSLARYLANVDVDIDAVFNFGIGGAYVQSAGAVQPQLLDLCLAETTILGDFGIVFADHLEQLSAELTGEIRFAASSQLTDCAAELLAHEDADVFRGNFVTVQSVSGTAARGEMLRRFWQGLCEEMEGAAVGRVCSEFQIPFIALRCISNMVEDRNPERWRLRESCERAGKSAAKIIKELST